MPYPVPPDTGPGTSGTHHLGPPGESTRRTLECAHPQSVTSGDCHRPHQHTVIRRTGLALRAVGAARELRGAARHAAYAAGQAAVVAHVAAHELGAAACAIKVVRAAAPAGKAESEGSSNAAGTRGRESWGAARQFRRLLLITAALFISWNNLARTTRTSGPALGFGKLSNPTG